MPAGPLYSALPGFCASVAAGPGPVHLRECRSGRATSWSVGPGGTLRSRGRCLALTFRRAGALAVAAKCNRQRSERWQIFGGPLAAEILSPRLSLCLAVPGDNVLSAGLTVGTCTTTDPGVIWHLG